MQRFLRVWGRFFFFAFYTLYAIMRYFFYRIGGKEPDEAAFLLRRAWLNRIPGVMGFKMKMEGQPYQGTCLYVGNHVSYVDPVAIMIHVDARVVAKAEVKKWPLLGFGAGLVGTIFVDRDHKDSRSATAEAIHDALKKGISILVFPEGTTTDGRSTIPFRPRSFLAAEKAEKPVQPISLHYDLDEVAYIGVDTFIPHFLRLFKNKNITGRIEFGPLLNGPDSCQRAQSWIDNSLTLYDSRYKSH